MRDRLFNSGLFDAQIDAVMERVKAAPENEAMQGRWNDDASGYPPPLLNVAWFSVKHHALGYIDETCPQAWFRPLFTNEPLPTD